MTQTVIATTAHRPTVLVVDDDKILRDDHRHEPRPRPASTSLERRPTGRPRWPLLDDRTPDVVVLDVVMPLMDGYATLGRIRRHATASHIPVIVLTGSGSDSADPVRSLEAGADDFIAKPFSPQEMLARVRAKVRRAAVDSSLQPLTRLPGNIAIEHEVRRRFEAREPWAVIYADLDNFKAYQRRTTASSRGDDAIRLVATTMSDTVKRIGDETDFLGHIGGDDFIIVTDAAARRALARTIAEHVRPRRAAALRTRRPQARLDRCEGPAR